MARLRAVAFDVLETLFSLEPLRPRLVAAGLPREALELWFAQTLRDGFALAAAGAFRPFAAVARGSLEVLLRTKKQEVDFGAIDQVMNGFRELSPHPDVAEAFALLRKNNVAILTISNGAAELNRHQLQQVGLLEHVQAVVSIEEVNAWKPLPEVYAHVVRKAGGPASQVGFVAAHGWDCFGAGRAGLQAAFLTRNEQGVSPALDPPPLQSANLVDLCRRLLALS
jgi:2-haloacid dehalogenase